MHRGGETGTKLTSPYDRDDAFAVPAPTGIAGGSIMPDHPITEFFGFREIEKVQFRDDSDLFRHATWHTHDMVESRHKYGVTSCQLLPVAWAGGDTAGCPSALTGPAVAVPHDIDRNRTHGRRSGSPWPRTGSHPHARQWEGREPSSCCACHHSPNSSDRPLAVLKTRTNHARPPVNGSIATVLLHAFRYPQSLFSSITPPRSTNNPLP